MHSDGICIELMLFCHEDICLILANSVDPDEMAHHHLGLLCLPKYLFAGIQTEKGKRIILWSKKSTDISWYGQFLLLESAFK